MGASFFAFDHDVARIALPNQSSLSLYLNLNMVYSCSTSIIWTDFNNKAILKTRNLQLDSSTDSMILQLQASIGRSLAKQEQQDVAAAFFLLNKLTSGRKLPRPFHMQAALEVVSGKNLVVRAGTGSGKTLAMALPMMLRPEWTFVTIAPLMALQKQHVSFIWLKLI